MYGDIYGGTPKHAGSSTYPSRMYASGGISDRGKEFSCPEQFAPLHRIYIFIIQVKPDERDRTCSEFISSKDRTVPVRKSAKVVDMRERDTLRGTDNRTIEPRYPVIEQGDIITMCMDYDNRARFVHLRKAVCRTVKVGKDRIRTDPMSIKHHGRCICCKYDPPYFPELVFQAGCIPADRDFIPASELS